MASRAAPKPGKGSYHGAVLSDRFRLPSAPTILTRTASVAPIGFTHLRSGVEHIRAREVPYEDAYAFHVALRPVDVDFWLDGKHVLATRAKRASAYFFDLRRNPISEFQAGFESFRFYISQQSIDELAFDNGQRHSMRLAASLIGAQDRVMYGLARALMDMVEQVNERSALFIDHIGLAFYAHIVERYATGSTVIDATGARLSPSQNGAVPRISWSAI